jgi:hypothetical protein
MITRRGFSGLLAAGALVGSHSSSLAAEQVSRPALLVARQSLLVIRTGTVLDDLFIAGVDDAVRFRVVTLDPASTNAAVLRRSLATFSNTRVVAMGDERSQLLLRLAFADLGAEFLCEGLHAGQDGTGMRSTHRFDCISTFHAPGTDLARDLASCGHGFELHETVYGAAPTCTGSTSRLSAESPWPILLGRALVHTAAGLAPVAERPTSKRLLASYPMDATPVATLVVDL